jgi:hypothetical protein
MGRPVGSTTPAEIRLLRREIADRILHLKRNHLSAREGAEMDRALGVPKRTLRAHLQEARAIPGEVLLRLIYRYDIEPMWLLRGTGPVFRTLRHSGGMCPRAADDGDGPPPVGMDRFLPIG